MASPFKRSDHIQPPDREGPSYGACLESGRWHLTLIAEELATDAVLDKVGDIPEVLRLVTAALVVTQGVEEESDEAQPCVQCYHE